MKCRDQSGQLSFFWLLLGLLLAATANAQTANSDARYSVVFKGQTFFTDRQPSAREVVEQGTLTVTRDGNSIQIVVSQIGSTMSMTRFSGTVGNSVFTAIHSNASQPNQVEVLWGRIEGDQIEGTLLYPRVADGLVPGYTELHFQGSTDAARPGSRTVGDRTLTPGLSGRMPTTTGSDSDTADASSKPSKVLKPKVPANTGNSVISGTITGDIGVVYNVQLIDADENTLQSQTLDSNGRYRFESLSSGQYWIYVNDRRAEAYIRTTRGSLPVNADGTSSYRIDFDVKN